MITFAYFRMQQFCIMLPVYCTMYVLSFLLCMTVLFDFSSYVARYFSQSMHFVYDVDVLNE